MLRPYLGGGAPAGKRRRMGSHCCGSQGTQPIFWPGAGLQIGSNACGVAAGNPLVCCAHPATCSCSCATCWVTTGFVMLESPSCCRMLESPSLLSWRVAERRVPGMGSPEIAHPTQHSLPMGQGSPETTEKTLWGSSPRLELSHSSLNMWVLLRAQRKLVFHLAGSSEPSSYRPLTFAQPWGCREVSMGSLAP